MDLTNAVYLPSRNICALSVATFELFILVNGEGPLSGERMSAVGGVVITTSLGVDCEAGEAPMDGSFDDRKFPCGIFQLRKLNSSQPELAWGYYSDNNCLHLHAITQQERGT